MYLNGELQWSAYPDGLSQWDIEGVLTHELGHALGLMHPCEPDGADRAPDCDDEPDAADSVMYPFYDDTIAALSSDDLAGLCFLYATPVCGEFGCGEGQLCTESGCVASCHDQECGPGFLCTEQGCRSVACVNGCDGAACKADRDCGPEETCDDGSCASDESAERDCRDDECPPPAEICGAAGAAGAGGACNAGASDLLLGAPCESSVECADGRCVSGAVESAICTRECGEDLPACPTHWACEAVSGNDVCVPRVRIESVGGGGCSVTNVRVSVPRGGLIFMLGAFVLLLRRRIRPKEKQS
jgi:hypothetical protein